MPEPTHANPQPHRMTCEQARNIFGNDVGPGGVDNRVGTCDRSNDSSQVADIASVAQSAGTLSRLGQGLNAFARGITRFLSNPFDVLHNNNLPPAGNSTAPTPEGEGTPAASESTLPSEPTSPEDTARQERLQQLMDFLMQDLREDSQRDAQRRAIVELLREMMNNPKASPRWNPQML